MKLHYGAWSSGENEAVVSINANSVLNENGDLTAKVITWDITCRIQGSDLADLKAKIAAAESAFEVSGQDIALKQGAVVAQELKSEDCVPQTVVVSPVTYPNGNNNELANIRTFSVSVQGEVPVIVSADNVFNEMLKYQWTKTNQKWQRVMSGEFSFTDDTTAEAAFTSFLDDNLPPTGYHREPYSYNVDGNKVSFSITDTEYWVELPENVSSGGYTTKTRTDGQSKIITVSGSFTGAGAEAAAELVYDNLSGGIVIDKDVTIDEYTGTVSFNYTLQSTAYNGGIIESSETITITRGGADFYLHEQLDGEAVRTETVQNRIWRATQTGSKTGIGSYPAPNPPKWTVDQNGKNPLKAGSQDTYKDGKRVVGGKIFYQRGWTYNFEASRNIFLV